MHDADNSALSPLTSYRIFPNFFPPELLLDLHIVADPSTKMRRAQQRVAGWIAGETGRRPTGYQKTDLRLDMLSKPRESLRRPPLPCAKRASDNPLRLVEFC